MFRNVSPRYEIVAEDAMSAQRSAVPEAVLCTTTVDDHTSASGMRRYICSAASRSAPATAACSSTATATPLPDVGGLGALPRETCAAGLPAPRPVEQMRLDDRPAVFTIAGHTVEAHPAGSPGSATDHGLVADVADADLVARVVSSEPGEPDRSGTLTSARVVVGAGRCTGSAAGFDWVLELAELDMHDVVPGIRAEIRRRREIA